MNLLCVGHCCHDLVADHYTLGGTASYAAAVATHYKLTSRIVTSVGDDFLFESFFRKRNISFHTFTSAHTTVYENIYAPGGRRQYLRACADPIPSHKISTYVKENDLILLCPIADEISSDILPLFDNHFIALTAQGLLREPADNGLIQFKNIRWQAWSAVDIVFLSIEDINYDEAIVEEIITHLSHVVLTYGAEGAKIYLKGECFYFPSYPTQEIDATGAGDTFTITYLIHYLRTKNIQASCIHAHCAASLVIEEKGTDRLPEPTAISTRVEHYIEVYQIS